MMLYSHKFCAECKITQGPIFVKLTHTKNMMRCYVWQCTDFVTVQDYEQKHYKCLHSLVVWLLTENPNGFAM